MPEISAEGRTLIPIEPDQPLEEREEGVEGAPKVEVKPTPAKDGEPTLEVPEKYRGKSDQELLKILVDRDKTVGEQGTRLKKIEDDLEFRQRLAENLPPRVPDRPQWEPAPKKEEPPEDTFVDYGTLKRVVTDVISKHDEVRQARDQKRLIDMVSVAHEEGLTVMKGNKLFDGIENKTSMALFQAFKPYVDQGYDVSQYLRDPRTWEKTAKFIRFQNGEYEYLMEKETKKPMTTVPVRPVEGETPTYHQEESGGGGDNVRLDEKSRYLMKTFGLSEEEAMEGIKSTRDARRRGEIL